MSLLVDGMQAALVRGVFSTSGPYPDQSLSDLFADSRASYLAASDPSTRIIRLAFPIYSDVTHAVACDCRRLALSWLQSTIGCWPEVDDKLALPWSLVRVYYSAFYAAHVVVRLLGRACCWLDASHIAQIGAVHRVVHGGPLAFRADAGSYLCSVDGAGSEFVLSRISTSNRGAHEALWHALEIALRDRTPLILGGVLPAHEAQSVVAKLDEFRALGTLNGSSAWLSKVRNAIQYRLQHEVWHPTGVDAKARRALATAARSWVNDPMSIDLLSARGRPPLEQFVLACSFVIAVCRALLGRIDAASTRPNQSFVRLGAGALASVRRVQLQ